MPKLTRRHFLTSSAVAGIAATIPAAQAAVVPGEKRCTQLSRQSRREEKHC